MLAYDRPPVCPPHTTLSIPRRRRTLAHLPTGTPGSNSGATRMPLLSATQAIRGVRCVEALFVCRLFPLLLFACPATSWPCNKLRIIWYVESCIWYHGTRSLSLIWYHGQAGIIDVQLVAACSSLLKGQRYLSGGTGPGRAFASLGVVLLFICPTREEIRILSFARGSACRQACLEQQGRGF